MKISSPITSVTGFSKLLAVFVFIFFILGSFVTGMRYGARTASVTTPFKTDLAKNLDNTVQKKPNLNSFFTQYKSEESTIYESKTYHYQLTVPNEYHVSLHGGLINELDSWIDINSVDKKHSLGLIISQLSKDESLAQHIKKSFLIQVDGKNLSNLKTPLVATTIHNLKGYAYEADMEGGRTKFICLQDGVTVYCFLANLEEINTTIFSKISQSFRLL